MTPSAKTTGSDIGFSRRKLCVSGIRFASEITPETQRTQSLHREEFSIKSLPQEWSFLSAESEWTDQRPTQQSHTLTAGSMVLRFPAKPSQDTSCYARDKPNSGCPYPNGPGAMVHLDDRNSRCRARDCRLRT